MKPLYSQEEYDKAKSCVEFPLACYYCGNTFYKEKRFIKSVLNRKIDGNKYCSRACTYNAQITAITTNCGNCNSKTTKERCEVKSLGLC